MFSEKIIKIVSKYNALEDCMGVVKKGFDKESVNLQDYLKTIRGLNSKQFKQLYKM